jgi:hypothetical protein
VLDAAFVGMSTIMVARSTPGRGEPGDASCDGTEDANRRRRRSVECITNEDQGVPGEHKDAYRETGAVETQSSGAPIKADAVRGLASIGPPRYRRSGGRQPCRRPDFATCRRSTGCTPPRSSLFSCTTGTSAGRVAATWVSMHSSSFSGFLITSLLLALDPNGDAVNSVAGVDDIRYDGIHFTPQGADVVARSLSPSIVRTAHENRQFVATTNASVGSPPRAG